MGNIVFKINERKESGKKARRNGEIPCILYGEHLNNTVPIEMTDKDMAKLLSCASNTIFSLDLNGENKSCVVKEIQRDVYGKVIHVDFQNVSKDEKIKMTIPLVFKGEGKLQSQGLLLETFITEVELYGETDEFPQDIECDVENFKYGNKIFGKDLAIPEGFKLEIKEDALIATVAYMKSAEDEEEDSSEN